MTTRDVIAAPADLAVHSRGDDDRTLRRGEAPLEVAAHTPPGSPPAAAGHAEADRVAHAIPAGATARPRARPGSWSVLLGLALVAVFGRLKRPLHSPQITGPSSICLGVMCSLRGLGWHAHSTATRRPPRFFGLSSPGPSSPLPPTARASGGSAAPTYLSLRDSDYSASRCITDRFSSPWPGGPGVPGAACQINVCQSEQWSGSTRIAGCVILSQCLG